MAGTNQYDLTIRKLHIAWELAKESLRGMGYWGPDGEGVDSTVMELATDLLP